MRTGQASKPASAITRCGQPASPIILKAKAPHFPKPAKWRTTPTRALLNSTTAGRTRPRSMNMLRWGFDRYGLTDESQSGCLARRIGLNKTPMSPFVALLEFNRRRYNTSGCGLAYNFLQTEE